MVLQRMSATAHNAVPSSPLTLIPELGPRYPTGTGNVSESDLTEAQKANMAQQKMREQHAADAPRLREAMMTLHSTLPVLQDFGSMGCGFCQKLSKLYFFGCPQQHMMCSDCINLPVNRGSTIQCPQCGVKMPVNASEARAHNDMVDKFKELVFVCGHCKTFSGNYDAVENHKEKGCPEEVVKCPGCDEKFERRLLKQHFVVSGKDEVEDLEQEAINLLMEIEQYGENAANAKAHEIRAVTDTHRKTEFWRCASSALAEMTVTMTSRMQEQRMLKRARFGNHSPMGDRCLANTDELLAFLEIKNMQHVDRDTVEEEMKLLNDFYKNFTVRQDRKYLVCARNSWWFDVLIAHAECIVRFFRGHGRLTEADLIPMHGIGISRDEREMSMRRIQIAKCFGLKDKLDKIYDGIREICGIMWENDQMRAEESTRHICDLASKIVARATGDQTKETARYWSEWLFYNHLHSGSEVPKLRVYLKAELDSLQAADRTIQVPAETDMDTVGSRFLMSQFEDRRAFMSGFFHAQQKDMEQVLQRLEAIDAELGMYVAFETVDESKECWRACSERDKLRLQHVFTDLYNLRNFWESLAFNSDHISLTERAIKVAISIRRHAYFAGCPIKTDKDLYNTRVPVPKSFEGERWKRPVGYKRKREEEAGASSAGGSSAAGAGASSAGGSASPMVLVPESDDEEL